MDSPNCFIEFNFSEDKNFNDLLSVFEKFKTAKNNEEPQEDEYWLSSFPDYSLKNFYFAETDIKPDFDTKENDEFTWHFYSLIELLQTNIEAEYRECFKIDATKARLEYYPWSYPYGGIEGLLTFVRSFNCIPTQFDDGTGIYSVDFFDNGDYKSTDVTNIVTDIPSKGGMLTKLFKIFKKL
jgi:hypothetical protein